MRINCSFLAFVMINLMSCGVLVSAPSQTNSNVALPVAPAIPVEKVLPAVSVEKGYDGRANDPMLPIHVSVVSPKPMEISPTSEVDFFFEVKNYTLAPYGNRLHVILDNQPPIVVDQLKRPLTLKDLSVGGHTLRVYAVKPDGRMVMDPQAFGMVYFYVLKKDFQNYINPNTPFLTVNLPFAGDVDATEDLTMWLDYRIHAAPEAVKGFKVRYKLSNIQGVDEIGKGVFWQGLKVGRYDLLAELLDSNGSVVSGLFSRVQRIFEIKPVQKAISTAPLDAPPVVPHE